MLAGDGGGLVAGEKQHRRCDFFGLEHRAALQENVSELFPGIAWDDVIATGGVVNRDLVVRYPELRFLNFYIAPLTPDEDEESEVSEAEELGGFVIILRDNTRSRERQMKEIESEKIQAVQSLAAGVAHEMNTPIQYFGDNLRFIRDSFSDIFMVLKVYHKQFRQLCRKGYDPHKIQELERAWDEADADFLFKEIPKSIDQSLQGVANLAHIVGAMKEFSHPGADNKIPINFNQVIENTLTIARNEWKYIAAVKLDLDETLPPVSCLPDEIRQMLLNLIINACHAIEGKGLNPEEKGTIRISTTLVQQEVPMVELRVQDSGTGIPDEVRNRIFEPFFTTKPVGKGTGQGLAIVHNVVIDKHSGQLHVESAVNKGTTFIICLPVNPPHSKEPE